MSDDRLIDADEVAEMFGMTPDWIYREVRAGRIPHIKMGRYVRFRRSSLEGWLDDQERGRITGENSSGRAARQTPPARQRR